MDNNIMWKIKIRKKTSDDLRSFLFSTAPKENACFLLTRTRGNIVFIVDLIKPTKKGWINGEEDSLLPSSEYISYCAMTAEAKQCSLAFIHTHPGINHPSTFSAVDEIGNAMLFKILFQLLSKPICSIVMSRVGLHAIVFDQGKQMFVESHHLIGNNYEKIVDARFSKKALVDEMFSRQKLFLGERKQSQLSNLKIAIIGCGGVGSPLATQLAKMGVGKLILFDEDKIDKTNLPRIYGSEISDIGKYKVDVLKRFIERTTSCKVEVHRIKIVSENDVLTDADLFFGGVDNMTARDVLNSVSIKYAIPFIDTGCYIPPARENFPTEAWVKLHVVTNERPCLWCSGTLNAHIIMEENLKPEEIEQRKRDGYYKTIDKQPSVISQTTFAAAVAVNRLFNLLGIFNSDYPSLVSYELGSMLYTEHEVMHNDKCRCNKNNPFRPKL